MQPHRAPSALDKWAMEEEFAGLPVTVKAVALVFEGQQGNARVAEQVILDLNQFTDQIKIWKMEPLGLSENSWNLAQIGPTMVIVDRNGKEVGRAEGFTNPVDARTGMTGMLKEILEGGETTTTSKPTDSTTRKYSIQHQYGIL